MDITVGLAALHIALVAVAFLIMLNEELRGARKAQIDAALGLGWIGLLIISFVVFGWKAGLAAVGLSFIYAGIMRTSASRVAHRLRHWR